MRIARRNTRPDSTPYEGVEFAFFDPQTNQRFSATNSDHASAVEVPSSWPIEVCSFFVQNCLVTDLPSCQLISVEEAEVPTWLWRKAVNPSSLSRPDSEDAFHGENSIRTAIDRLAGGWTYLGWQGGYFDSEEDAKSFYDEARWMLCHRRFTPELMQWQQTGVYWAYGLETVLPETFVTDFQTGLVRRSKTHDVAPPKRPMPPSLKRTTLDGSDPGTLDDLWADSTADAQSATHLMGYSIATRHIQGMIDAYRECQISRKTTGTMSAALRLAIQSARGAQVPENIIDRTLELIEQNCEVRASDILGPPPGDDLDAANSDNDVTMVRLDDGPIDLAVDGNAQAYQLFDAIAYGAWTGRKTGIHYATTVGGWNTCPDGGEIDAASDNGDFLFLDDTGCNRATINCTAFRDGNFGLAVDDLRYAVELITLALDIGHTNSAQITPRTANRVWNYRPLGLSVTGIAELIMSYGLPYDSEDARAIAAIICSLITAIAYKKSADLASEMGAFPSFEINKNSMLRVIRNHRRATDCEIGGYEGLGWVPHPINPRRALPDLYAATVNAWKQAERQGEIFGFRNAQVTLVSPDLNASSILDSHSFGLEPMATLCHQQVDDHGEYQPTIPAAVRLGLAALGYNDREAETFIESLLGRRSLKGAPAINYETLRKRGFNGDLIDKIEDALPNAVDLSQVFNPWILGVEKCVELLGVDSGELENPEFDLLAAMGFSDAAIEECNRYCFGNQAETELPYRDLAHAVVFVTGDTSTQKIHHTNAIIRMMAATQPMISGGIGHALALPRSTSVADFHVLLLTGWRLGLKSLCLYRDEFDYSDLFNPTATYANDVSTENARPTSPPLTVIEGGQSSAKTGVMA